MDKKLTERRLPADEVLKTYKEITPTDEKFMKSLQNADQALAASSTVVALRQEGIPNVTAEQLELEDGKVSYEIAGDFPAGLTEEQLKNMVDVTDRFPCDLSEETGKFVLKEG